MGGCADLLREMSGLLQENVLNRQAWHTREQLRIAIITWIGRTYHRRRRQAALGRLTPRRVRDHHYSGNR